MIELTYFAPDMKKQKKFKIPFLNFSLVVSVNKQYKPNNEFQKSTVNIGKITVLIYYKIKNLNYISVLLVRFPINQ